MQMLRTKIQALCCVGKDKHSLTQNTYTNLHIRNFTASKANEARHAISNRFSNCHFAFEITVLETTETLILEL
jgi:hypothetical protein